MPRLLLLLIVTLAAGALLVEALPSRPAQAAFPGANGKIAFGRDGYIYMMNPDGTGVTRLTNNGAEDFSPAWSPDGTRIAFASQRDGNNEIYVMNADGSGQTRLTNTPDVSDWEPAWSPEGAKIAFMREVFSGGSCSNCNFDIYVMDADGSGQTNLTNNPGVNFSSPAWSPDGTKIVFVSGSGVSVGVSVMNADGSGVTVLAAGGSQPAWSPDGSKIAFFLGHAIYVMDADGSSQTNLTNTSDLDRGPAWSPDGGKIAFSRCAVVPGLCTWEIYVMNADGSGQTRLTRGPLASQSFDADWQPLPAGDVNCRGDVNSIDALLVLQFSARLIAALPCQEDADVNGDGEVGSRDAALILQYVAGLISSLPP